MRAAGARGAPTRGAIEAGLGHWEHHEGAETDQLLVQQEHHGRVHNLVNDTMHAGFASWVDVAA
jgi:hypothetical protein